MVNTLEYGQTRQAPKGSDYVPRERGSYRFPREILLAIELGAKRQRVSQNA